MNGWFNKQDGIGKAYDFFINKNGRWPWKPIIWKSCILPKHRFCLWLLAHGKLLTKDRHIYILDKLCVFCSCVDESAKHLFFECTVSCQIWSNICEWLGMRKLMAGTLAVLRAFRGVYRGGALLGKLRAELMFLRRRYTSSGMQGIELSLRGN